jgi:ATP-dependent helicase HrpB
VSGPYEITRLEPAIVECLRAGSRLLLQAPTGSGKSTQLPQMLWRHGMLELGQVVVLQPRRIAARMLAAFVARECGVRLGGEVGYQIRFENVTSAVTRIRYVTEGVLLRQLIMEGGLPGVAVVVFDEFHERHLYGDITLARVLDLQEGLRPDLKVVVMSATLDVVGLEGYLSPCRVLRSEGRTFPVEVEFLPYRVGASGPPVWELAAEAYGRQRRGGGAGDALIFMPGGYEIQQTLQALRTCPEARGAILLPLHGELASADQDAALERYDRPKIVVSTNVAETSLTIDGVRLVIDSGLARIPRYDAGRGINTLWVERISQAAADQRAGRAGRTAPGRCIRLWSMREHSERALQEVPEVGRLELSEVVLMLKAAGVGDLRGFRWLEAPAADALTAAERLLMDLGALDPKGNLTPLGGRMLAFPIHPRYARMLIEAHSLGCVREAAMVAAMMQGRELMVRKPGREVVAARLETFGDRGESDFGIWMRAWEHAAEQGYRIDACRRLGVHALGARQVGILWEQFLGIAKREGLEPEVRAGGARDSGEADEALRRCVLAGFPDRLARRLDQGTLRCELAHGRRGVLARESVVQDAPFLVACEVREVQGASREVTTILSMAVGVEVSWLEGMFPGSVERGFEVGFDAVLRRVVGYERQRFRGLELAVRRVEPPPVEAAARILADEVLAGRVVLPSWDHGVEQWILRLNRLAEWCPELELPRIRDEDRRHLLEQICHGAFSARDLKEREARGVVVGWLSGAQRALVEREAPERLRLVNGRTPKVVYEAGNPPFIALRIQELFGVETVPAIGLGRVPVVVRVLAPNMRPVQVTQDLRGFWRDQYPRLRQELRRKYPKHEWR